MATHLTADRLGDWEANERYVAHENGLLQRLAEEPDLAAQLLPVTPAELVPGLVLFYRLCGDWGCHILRSRADGYQYRPDTNIRASAAAGAFYTLP